MCLFWLIWNIFFSWLFNYFLAGRHIIFGLQAAHDVSIAPIRATIYNSNEYVWLFLYYVWYYYYSFFLIKFFEKFSFFLILEHQWVQIQSILHSNSVVVNKKRTIAKSDKEFLEFTNQPFDVNFYEGLLRWVKRILFLVTN